GGQLLDQGAVARLAGLEGGLGLAALLDLAAQIADGALGLSGALVDAAAELVVEPADLLGCLLLLGDVAHDAEGADDGTVAVAQRELRVGDPSEADAREELMLDRIDER